MSRTKDIGTRITRGTPPGTSLFRELGFSPAESKRFQRESRRAIRESKQDLAAGRFVKESIRKHISRARKLAR